MSGPLNEAFPLMSSKRFAFLGLRTSDWSESVRVGNWHSSGPSDGSTKISSVASALWSGGTRDNVGKNSSSKADSKKGSAENGNTFSISVEDFCRDGLPLTTGFLTIIFGFIVVPPGVVGNFAPFKTRNCSSSSIKKFFFF